MSQSPKCTHQSDLHQGKKTTLTLQRVLDSLKTDLQNEPAENNAISQFKKDLSFIEQEYKGISEIVNAYEKAYKDFNGAKKNEAQKQWESIMNWSDNMVPKKIAGAITSLRDGEFYAGKEKKLKKDLERAEEEYYSLHECYQFYEVKEKRAIQDLEQAKSYEKTVGDSFKELKNLYEAANSLKDAGKHNSVFAVRLEFDDIRKKTIAEQDGGGLADPETFKNNLTSALRKVIAFKHERFLWHKDFIAKQDKAQKDLQARQSAFEKAKQSYEDHILNKRDRMIREAEDIQPDSDATSKREESKETKADDNQKAAAKK